MEATKDSNNGEQVWLWLGAGIVLCLAIIAFLSTWPPHSPSQGEIHEHHHMSMSMPMAQGMEGMESPSQAKLLADKKESEFNHHLAGLLVILAGAFISLQSVLVKRWPVVKYVWPACFLLAGIFLLVWSDTELWPFGHREWLEALRNNREVLQHKVFAVLLLGLGVIEWQRARGVLKAAWSAWVFPALAIGGSLLLLFHQHEGGMHGPNHMELMAQIQWEHLTYAVTGISLGLVLGLSRVKTRLQPVFEKLWPLPMIVLGVLLMFYRE